MTNNHLEALADPKTNGKRKVDDRASIEAVVASKKYLPPQDRDLVEVVFEQGANISALARLMGKDPNSLHMKVTQLKKKFQRPAAKRLLAIIDQIPPESRDICLEHFIGGKGVPAICKELGIEVRWATQMVRRYREYLYNQS